MAQIIELRQISYAKTYSRSKEFTVNEIDVADQAQFIEVTETELMNLHEGNMARYRIRPSEFNKWKKHWSEG